MKNHAGLFNPSTSDLSPYKPRSSNLGLWPRRLSSSWFIGRYICILFRGLKFGIPPNVRKETIAAEFELAWQQLPRAGIAKDVELQCKAEMTSLAHRYSNSKIDYSGYRLNRQHISAIKNLKNKKEIIITKPDKSNGVVLLTKDDYIRKMRTILEDTSKFVHLGDADTKDRTTQQERALQALHGCP